MEIWRKKNKISLLCGENVIWIKYRVEFIFFFGGGEEVGRGGMVGG